MKRFELTEEMKKEVFAEVKRQIADAKEAMNNWGNPTYTFMLYDVYGEQGFLPEIPMEDDYEKVEDYEKAMCDIGKQYDIAPLDAFELYTTWGETRYVPWDNGYVAPKSNWFEWIYFTGIQQ